MSNKKQYMSLRHEIEIFSLSDSSKIIKAFAGFMCINQGVKEDNHSTFGNSLINSYFAFRIRYQSDVTIGMNIRFAGEDKRRFSILDVINEEEKNVFLKIIAKKHIIK